MADFLAYLKESGPFTAPLCVGMVFVIRWLLAERDRLIGELKEQAADATQLRDKRIDDREAAAVEYRQFGEAMRDEMRTFNERSSAALEELRRPRDGG